jgi:RND superfamily putative drug exporter
VIAASLILVAILVVVSRASGQQTSDNLTLPGTGSTTSTDLLEARLPQQAYGTNPIVLQARTGKLTDSKNKKAVEDTVSSLKKAPHVVRAVSPLSTEGATALSKDKTIGYISVTLDVSQADLDKDQAEKVIDASDPARQAGLKVATGGYLGQEVSKPKTETSEAIGLAAAVIILLFAFGTATAMSLPIITAVLGLVSSLSIITFLGHATEVPTVAPTLATMIGLGVGIDYALFIVTRHKLQLRDGMEMRESIARATATAGGAVFFAGTTVVIALCSLAFSGIPLVRTLGFSAAVAVLVAVITATTLLPALLGALGPRINSLRVKLGRTHPDDHQPHGWARWAERVTAKPWRWVIASTAFLVVLALPLLQLQLGQNDVGALSKSTTARQAYDLISEGFGVGQNGPLLIATKFGTPAKPDQKKVDQANQQEAQLQQKQQQLTQQGEAAGLSPQQAQAQAQQKTAKQQSQLEAQKKQASSPASDPRLVKVEDDIKKTPGVKSVSPATTDKHADAAVFTVVATTAPSSEKTEDLVNHLRDDVIPSATKGTDLTVSVGGQTAAYIDLAKQISKKLASMIAIVVALSFVVLMIAFRSILVPLKAAIANLLSVAAAYGVLTAVFQKGWGAELIGLDGSIPIVSFVPLLMFAILFGLSMDYEVFLMTQIQDHYHESKNARKGVVDGLASTGRVITSAALIMVCVFSSFIVNGDPVVKEFGVGLAVAIAIDATVVRCMLVPAVMALLDRSAWWMPRWLDRVLPRISIEGEDYFAKQGATRKPAPASRAAHG